MRFDKTVRSLTIVAAQCLVAIFSSTSSAAVIISQYYEGASNDKYIELYNTGPASVDLGTDLYKLSNWSNALREDWKTGANPATGTQALTGTIAPGATFIIGHTNAANPPYVVVNDSDATQGGVNFNGDDSSVLWTGATYSFANVVDAFGATNALATFAGDKSFVRNPSVVSGTNGDFNAGDWTEYSVAAVASASSSAAEYLGAHVVIPEPSSIVMMAAIGLALGGIRRRFS